MEFTQTTLQFMAEDKKRCFLFYADLVYFALIGKMPKEINKVD
jgi:hypothetical protein